MNGPFQNHERDVRTSPRLRPSTDRYPEERQHCDGTTSGLSLEWCDVRLVDWESFEGADANMVPIGDDETPCLKGN